MTSFLEPKQKTLDSRQEASGKDGDLEPPRPLVEILRDAKRANSPAINFAISPQPRGCKFPSVFGPNVP